MKNLDVVLASIWKLIGALFLILLPIRPMMIAVTCLVIADLISGVWASLKERKKITSNSLRRTFNKALGYQLGIVFAFIIETYLLPEMPITKGITFIVAMTEAKSFFENLHRITGIDFWTMLLAKLNMEDIKNPKDDQK